MKKFLYDEMYEEEKKHWWFKAKRKIILDLIDKVKQKHMKILDSGCGCGYILPILNSYGEVSAMDFSQYAIEYAKKNFDGVIKEGDLNGHIPYEYNTFDLILSLDVLEHVPDDKLALKNLYNLLDINGKIVITVPAHMFLWSYHDENHMHKRRYNKSELRNKLKNSGFTIQYLSYYNTLLFIPITLVRIIKKTFVSNEIKCTDGNLPNKWLNKILYLIFISENFFIKRFICLPFGVSLIAVVEKENK